MSQKPEPIPEAPFGPPPPSYTPSVNNPSAPPLPPPMNPPMNQQNMPQPPMPYGDNNYAPGTQMGYPPPQQGFPPPQQGFPPAGGYYAHYQGAPPNNGYGQPPNGAYYASGPPQGQFVDDRGKKGSPGFLEGLLAACACCCCLDLLF